MKKLLMTLLAGMVVVGVGVAYLTSMWPFNTVAVTAFLSFPLPNRNASTAIINSVFDHSQTAPYTPDDTVVAYTGEMGEKVNGSDFVTTVAGISLFGLKNAAGSSFVVNGAYSGGTFLYYDGHPGYDYRTIDQSADGKINVLAAAAGVAHLGGAEFGTVVIDHGNGYETLYLHLSQRNVTENQNVLGGQVVGISGDVGSPGSPHLHFEVRRKVGMVWVPVDPYGWTGKAPDPYVRATNVNLWK